MQMIAETGDLPRPQSREVLTCVRAGLVLPQTRHQAFAVVDANGAPVVDALTARKSGLREMAFVDRTSLTPVETLEGRYLFGGEFWWHFGHFLFESLSRLWALDHLEEPVKGLIFLNVRGERPIRRVSPQRQLLTALGVDLPVHMVSHPTEVEHLLVPRQGFGLGALAAGTPAARQFFRDRFGKIEPRQGAERIYISRAGYKMKRGGMLAEDLLEKNLITQGYTLFSPEEHSIQDQIATYRGAKKIIAPDSSALHLFGFVGRPDQDLAIVLRRTEGASDLLPQITGFTGRKPLVLDHIQRMWTHDKPVTLAWREFAQVDFAALGRSLLQAGFIDDLSAWQTVRTWQLTQIRKSMQRVLDCEFTISTPRRARPGSAQCPPALPAPDAALPSDL